MSFLFKNLLHIRCRGMPLGINVQSYGGRNTSAVSKKTNYLIRGVDPGQNKSQKANELGIEIITEQQFWDIVKQRSQKIAKDCGFNYNPQKCTFEQSLLPINEENSPKEIDKLINKFGEVYHQDLFWKERQEQQKIQQNQIQQNQFPNIIDKYRPQTIEQLIGIRKIIDTLSFNIRKNKIIKLYGQNGTGKTLLTQLVCKELNYQILLINGDEDKDELQYKLQNTMNYGFNKQKKCMVVDQADYNQLSFNKQIYQFHKDNEKFPLIFIQNEKISQQTSFLSNNVEQLFLTKCKQPLLTKFIEEICLQEKIQYQSGLPNLISSLSQGDFYKTLMLFQSSIEMNKDQQYELSRQKINSFNNFTKTDTWMEYVESTFMFNKFRLQKQQPMRELQNMFYNNQPNSLSLIMQNVGQYTDYDYEYAYQVYDYFSLADNIQFQMYKNSDWQSAQAQMTYSTLLPALQVAQSQLQLKKQFRYPQFGRIGNLQQEQNKVFKAFQTILQGIVMSQMFSSNQLTLVYYILKYNRDEKDIQQLFSYYDENIKAALQQEEDKFPNTKQIIKILDNYLTKQIKEKRNKSNKNDNNIKQEESQGLVFQQIMNKVRSQLTQIKFQKEEFTDDL